MPVEPPAPPGVATGSAGFRHGRFETGQRLGTRFRIVARLGEGGMGEVYRADDLELGQSVALKFLPERVAADEAWLQRFRNEVRTARQIAHPNVCRTYDIGQTAHHVYISMEYVDGEDLARVLRRMGRPSPEKAVEIARQICLGLAAAHDNGVLHRDLKPANIMIDGRGRVRITDFGLAGFLDELEGVRARAGTPAYMAPEQLTAGAVSVQSDIYSLGLILHELFTGKCVFETNDVEELKRQHTSGTITRPSSGIEDIDPAVERVIQRCLEPDPARRPRSVHQLLAALPGGDPLAAALAAGEIPAPELVANARDAGGLGPRAGIALLVACLASVAIACVVSTMTTVTPVRSPARLAVIAEQVMERLGLDDLPALSVSGYDSNVALNRAWSETSRTREQLRDSAWPPKYRYWRRWSTDGLLPSDPHFPEQFAIDGPTHSPTETAMVALDSEGRLIELAIAPALTEGGERKAPEEAASWLLEIAGLDPSRAERVAPSATPPIFCDHVTAWRVDAAAPGQDPRLVQVGSTDGRPSYLEFVELRGDLAPSHAGLRDAPSLASYGWVALDLLLIVLAIRNLRAGRADRRNAFRCALFVGGLYLLLEIVAIGVGGLHPGEQIHDLVAGRAVGHFLQHGIEAWVYYLAIEPYVRRIWPRMLIGLVRVVAGRWRDPAVGREVLIGLATGSALAALVLLVAPAEALLSGRSSAHLAMSAPVRVVLSPGHHVSNIAHLFAWSVLAGVCGAGVVVLLRVLVRNPIASNGLAVAAIAGLEHGLYVWSVGESTPGLLVFSIGLGACLVWLYSRVGVLAAMLCYFVILALPLFALPLRGWIAPYLITWLALLLAIAAGSLWIALAGQPIFKDMLAEPQGAT